MPREDLELLKADLLDELFDAVPDALAVVDRDLRFVRVNSGMALLHERPSGSFLGLTIEEALPERAAAIEPLVLRALAGETIRNLDFRATAPGNERRFTSSYIPLRDDSDDVVAMLIMLREISIGEDVERTLEFTRERLEMTLEGTRAGIFEWNSQSGELRWSAGMGPLFGRSRGWVPADYDAYMEVMHPEDRDLLAGDVRRAIADGTDYEREFRCIWPTGQERWLHSRVQSIADDRGGATLLGLVSDIHERRVREQAELMLARVSAELGQSLDLDRTTQTLAGLLVPDLADWVEVALFDDAGAIGGTTIVHREPELTAAAQRLYELSWSGTRGASLTERMRSGRTYLRADLDEAAWDAFSDSDEHLALMRTLHPRAVLSVPMIARGKLIGAITLFAASEGRIFGPARASIAEEVGRRAATAVDNARLWAAQQSANQALGHLQAVTDATLDNLEFDELLTELTWRVKDYTVADFAAVMLRDPERGDLVLAAAEGLPGADASDVRLDPTEGVAGVVLESGDSLFVEDLRASTFSSVLEDSLDQEIVSLLAVPLLAEGAIVGVLQVGTLTTPRSFTDPDISLLKVVAERAGRGIVNASLYSEARATSSMLQGSLLPEALPAIEGYELDAIYRSGLTTAEVGGDWYDGFALPDGRVALAIGDVVGRGLRAAALMGQLRAATRAYARERSDPGGILSQVDRLVEDLVAVPFATMILLVLEPQTGALEIASAGHPPPVLRSSGLLASLHGPPLGAPMEHERAPATRFELAEGDVLVLYTDGMVEVRDEPLQSRLDRLAAAVAAGPARPMELLEHLESEMLGEGLRDDTAAIAIRRLGSPRYPG